MITENGGESRSDLTFEKVWKMFQETGRQMNKTDRKISKPGNRLGDLAEHIIAPKLLEKFNRLKFNFGRIGHNVRFRDSGGNFVAKADILLENGDTVMAVAVKSKVTTDDVKEHTVRMEKLRAYADEHGDKRQVMGAVASAIIPESVKSFAFKHGFYVIEQAGDTVSIDAPQGFVPQKW